MDETADPGSTGSRCGDRCAGAVLPTGGRCWEHAADADVEQALEQLGEHGRLDASGVTISNKLLKRMLAATPHDSEGRPVLTDARFAGATFGSWAAFDPAGATFGKVVFKGEADFKKAIFKGDSRFGGATFEGADFRGATFEGAADFYQTTFTGKGLKGVNFAGATFQGTATFATAIFKGRTIFASATFEAEANFHNAFFDGVTNFYKAAFKHTADFTNAEFVGKAEHRAKVGDVANFDGQIRAGILTGSGPHGMTSFREAVFHDVTQFNEARFCGLTAFYEATFEQTPLFRLARFRGITTFGNATFRRSGDFSGAVFHGHVGSARRSSSVSLVGVPRPSTACPRTPRASSLMRNSSAAPTSPARTSSRPASLAPCWCARA
jgi:uncharacterized protein YjbI with pentapeptide repeats